MDQVQVDVVEPQIGQGLPDGRFDVLRSVVAVPQFRGDEQFLPPDDSFPERVAQSLSHFFFVSVKCGSINQAVSVSDGCRNGESSFFFEIVNAKPENRHSHTIV